MLIFVAQTVQTEFDRNKLISIIKDLYVGLKFHLVPVLAL